jgi:hypothetical protein
MIAD